MSTTVWSSTGGTTVTQSLADQAATSATAAATSATAAATSATEAAASATEAANAASGLKVSSDDTTGGVLEDKLLPGTGVSFVTNNSGANETRTINVSGFQSTDATLTALAGLTVSADQMIYATGSDAFATASLTAAGRALLDDADAAAQRQTLSAQEADATLTALAGVSVGADQLIYATGSDAFATASLTAAGRALIDDSDVATMRGTLGLGTAATSASSAFLASASPSVSSGTLTLTSSGLTFSDGTTQTSASSGGGSSLTVADENSDLSTAATKLDFVGAGVTASGTGATKTITVPGGLEIQDEGSALSTQAQALNFVGSGVTASGTGATKTITISGGGGGSMSNLSDDSSPQLSGDLDLNGNDIVTTSNANLDLAPNGTGYVVVRGNTNSGKLMLNCENNSHGVSIASPPHSANATYDLTLPTSLSAGALYTSSGGQLSTGDLPVADGGTGASDQAGAQQNLGLQIGTDILAYDAGLNSIAGLTTAADKMIYTTGSDTYAVTDLSAQARSLLDDADAAAMRSTIGLGTMATAATSDYVAKAGSTMTGQLVLDSTGIQFSDSTTLTTAPTAGINFGKAVAAALIF